MPSVVLDTILPPALAYSLGVEAERRARLWTGEGYWIPGIGRDGFFACDCHNALTIGSTKHFKSRHAARDFSGVRQLRGR